MHVNGKQYSTIWYDSDNHHVSIIDQTRLPHQFTIIQLKSLDDFCHAIQSMQVRGAPLIGATAAFGLAMAVIDDSNTENISHAYNTLLATRPTAVNLRWALDRISATIKKADKEQQGQIALAEAERIRQEDIKTCEAIGEHGLALITEFQTQKSGNEVINILTHCNAGWLATVDWGTALAPIYKAHNQGLPIHVWVDETRPRNQGASLTAWELSQHGIPHTVISDNTGGHLMQNDMVDLCIVGTDRTTASGDVCNKIGTYLKALAAADNGIPFYVALPASTVDWTIDDGLKDIPIEIRDAREVTHISGKHHNGDIVEIQLVEDSTALNYAFDVTPARLVSGLITEHGIFSANRSSLNQLKQNIAH